MLIVSNTFSTILYTDQIADGIQILEDQDKKKRLNELLVKLHAPTSMKHLLSLAGPNGARKLIYASGLLLKRYNRKIVDTVLPAIFIDDYNNRFKEFIKFLVKRNSGRAKRDEVYLNHLTNDVYKVWDNTKNKNYRERATDIYLEISSLHPY